MISFFKIFRAPDVEQNGSASFNDNSGNGVVPNVNGQSAMQQETNSNLNGNQILPVARERVIYFNSEQRGLINGVIGVDKEPFQTYTHNHFEAYVIAEAANRQAKKVKDLEDEIARAKVELNESTKGWFEAQQNLQFIAHKKSFLETNLGRLKVRLQTTKDLLLQIKEKYNSDYTFIPAMFFFLAGLLFIAADFGLALTIIGDALKIGIKPEFNPATEQTIFKPTVITYLFAAALAGLSFALKPAYDRLIEKPYPSGNSKKIFNWTIILVSLLVLFMLFAMGVFRENVIEQTNMLAAQASNNSNFDPFAEPTQTEPIGTSEIPSTEAGRNKLVHNLWALISIVLSTCLFAITGAICMGIALPVIHRNVRIGFNYIMQFNYRRRIYFLEKKSIHVFAEFGRMHLISEETVQRQNAAKELLAKKADLDNEVKIYDELNQKYFSLRADKANALFLDGYNRGALLKDSLPDEWAKDQIFSGTDDIEGVEGKYEHLGMESDGKGNLPFSRSRPFIAVRKMITGRFKRKYFDTNEADMDVN